MKIFSWSNKCPSYTCNLLVIETSIRVCTDFIGYVSIDNKTNIFVSVATTVQSLQNRKRNEFNRVLKFILSVILWNTAIVIAYWASGKYSGQDLWSLADEKFLLNFQKLTLNLNSMTFKFPEFCPDCQNVLLSESNISDSFVNTSSQFSAWFTTDAISVSPCQVSIPEQYSFSAAKDNVL